MTSSPLVAAASLAGVFSLPPGLRRGVLFVPPRVLVLPLAGFDAGGFGAGSAGDDFAADETSLAVDFAAADFDGDRFVGGFEAADALLAADDLADVVRVDAGLRAARPALPDAARAVAVVPGVVAPAARVAAGAGPVGVTSVSRSSRRKRLPSPAPAPTTLRPCSIAVSRMFFGESGMR